MEKQEIEKRKCTRCKVNLPNDMFTLRRNREYNKMCNDCLKKRKEWNKKQKNNNQSNINNTNENEHTEEANKKWYYHIEAREGAPGCADDVEYISDQFSTFAECYKNYVQFNPREHWYYFRHVQREHFIYENNGIIHKNPASHTNIYYIKERIEETLGITEKHFDDVLNEL